MCSYGPIVLGHRHPAVEAAARRQLDRGDCQNGPGEALVELAERFVDVVDHADWALFAKNGTDATTTCVTVARAHDRAAQGARRRGRLPRRGAVVHAGDRRRRARGPRPPAALPLQRPRVGDEGRRVGARRRRRDRRVAVQARRPPRPGARRPGVRQRAAGRLRRRRRGAHPRRRPLRLPARPRRQLGAARRPPRPVGVEQGDRQRLPARRRRRQRPLPQRRPADLRHRLVLVRRRADGRCRGDDRRARRRGRRGLDGAHRPAPARRAGPAGRPRTACGSTRPARCRCR